MRQFQLLSQRRFGPLFATQFLGAFNDNLYKNALVVLLVFAASHDATVAGDTHALVNLAAGLFILPFFLFSALAGQLADKYDKTRLIRAIKLAEIGVMLLGAAALLLDSTPALLAVLFLLGAQSAFFGPVKYAVLPQVLARDELVGGNAQVEMGTFVAILLGTICGGLTAGLEQAQTVLALLIVLVAATGWGCSRSIPSLVASAPNLQMEWNPWRQTWQQLAMARRRRSVFVSMLAISWFWLLGSAYLTQVPAYTKSVLQGDNTLVTLILSLFTVGVALGSLMCERLSRGRVEIGLVPLGALGLSLSGLDLYFASQGYQAVFVAEPLAAGAFLEQAGSSRILLDLTLVGVFGGIYIVPLYAMIQARTPEPRRSRVIAVNNILNALFMVLSSLTGMLVLGYWGWTIPEFFLALAVANVAFATWAYWRVPAFIQHFGRWLGRLRRP